MCRLGPETAVPAWAGGPFVSLTRTADELSIVCAAERIPAEILAERDWRVLQLVGPFPFTAVGVLASLAAPLARAGCSMLAIATYDTDYLLVKNGAFETAVAALVVAGHTRID